MENYSQYTNRQPNYQQTPSPYAPQWPPMTMGQWMGTMLLMCIPFANFILMFVWAFGSDVNPSKKSYFQAALLLAAIMLGLWIVIVVIVAVTVGLGAALSNLSS